MKRNLALLFAIIGWFAIIGQYILMIEYRATSLLETNIRFFSFFTIQVNLIVAIYFTCLLLPENKRPTFINAPGTLTAVTIYITMVGLTYQIALRHIWNPQGLQLIVNELLHSVIPVLVIIFWYLYENKKPVRYAQIPKWSIYPLLYLAFILIRGSFSGFYPYYFIDVAKLGLEKTLIHAGVIFLAFLIMSVLYISLGKLVTKR